MSIPILETHGIHYIVRGGRRGVCFHRLDGSSCVGEYFIFGRRYTTDEYWHMINIWKMVLLRLYIRRKLTRSKHMIEAYYHPEFGKGGKRAKKELAKLCA